MARVGAYRGIARDGRGFTVLAIAFGLAAGVLVFAVLRSARQQNSASSADLVPVAVAAANIPARTKITANMVRIESMPPDVALKDAFATEKAVAGLVTRYPITAKEQITAQKVGAVSIGKEGLSAVVPDGMRAVAVSITESSAVGGLVVAGDRVDVIALLNKELTGLEKATTILQDVEVLSVAQAAQEPLPPSVNATSSGSTSSGAADARSGARPTDVKPQPQARSVTLAVKPADAQLLALVQQNGQIWLALRGVGEQATPSLSATDLLPLGALPLNQRPR